MVMTGAVAHAAVYPDPAGTALPGGGTSLPLGNIRLHFPPGTQGAVTVQLYASAAVRFAGPVLSDVAVTIVRGSSPAEHAGYSGIRTYEVKQGNVLDCPVDAVASDYNVPVPPSLCLEYTVLLSSDAAGKLAEPACFEAVAFRLPV